MNTLHGSPIDKEYTVLKFQMKYLLLKTTVLTMLLELPEQAKIQICSNI